MKTKDLQIGMEVAVKDGYGNTYTRGFVVAVGGWKQAEWFESVRVGSAFKEDVKGKEIALAMPAGCDWDPETKQHVGLMNWKPVLKQPQAILSSWADYERAEVERKAHDERARALQAKQAAKDRSEAATLVGRLEDIGIELHREKWQDPSKAANFVRLAFGDAENAAAFETLLVLAEYGYACQEAERRARTGEA